MLELINVKYMNFLFEISKRPQNISELAKKGDLTLSVASNLISRLTKEGVLSKDRTNGREIIITLTPYGRMQVKLLKEINENNNQKNIFLTTTRKK